MRTPKLLLGVKKSEIRESDILLPYGVVDKVPSVCLIGCFENFKAGHVNWDTHTHTTPNTNFQPLNKSMLSSLLLPIMFH